MLKYSHLPDRLMVGQRPLEAFILVRIQVRQPAEIVLYSNVFFLDHYLGSNLLQLSDGING